MPSASKQRRAAKKKAVGGAKKAAPRTAEEEARAQAAAEAAANNPRTVTASLASTPTSRDVQFDLFTLQFYGQELISEARLELNYGRRYGLIGANGSGKSTMLKCLGEREVPIPDHVDIHLLQGEEPASDISALNAILRDVEEERDRLDAEAAKVLEESGPDSPLLLELYDRIELLDADTAERRAAEILFGLGFTAQMQNKATKEFSGGWRMRIALARALFLRPHLLLLDEPTNHLDLDACVWLEEYLAGYDHCLVMVSHSQDFLNGVCTNIMHLQNKVLKYYGGNYDSFCQTRSELEEAQMKKYNWEQDQIAHMKNYIARFGHGSAKLAKQAQSKEKVLAKMQAGGLTEKVANDQSLALRFTDVGKLSPPVLQFQGVSFHYPGEESNLLYRNIDLSIDLDSRVALVGPNGAGKSTLLKLMTGDLNATDGMVRRHNHLRIARYHQHLDDQLDAELSPLEYMMKEFPEIKEPEAMRSVIGRFGLTGAAQVSPIKNLSDGQKSRVVFSWMASRKPHMLLLDEPTNHLDIETIDALAAAINLWDGGMILVSHDFRLIGQVAKEIWECNNQTCRKWPGDIQSYKEHLREKVAEAKERNAKA